MKAATKNAALLIIGNEILSGRTQDANLRFLAPALNELGIQMNEVRIVRDEMKAIISALDALRATHTYVFTTGGIGPTHDDITADAVAAAFGAALERHEDAVRHLERHYPQGELNEARLRMARIPQGASLIENPVSAAPGFHIGNVFVMAGVPEIMQAMFDTIRDQLTGGVPKISRTVVTTLAEGKMAGPLGQIQESHPKVEIGSYPFIRGDRLGTAIVLRSTVTDELDVALSDVFELAQSLGGQAIEEEIPAEARPAEE